VTKKTPSRPEANAEAALMGKKEPLGKRMWRVKKVKDDDGTVLDKKL